MVSDLASGLGAGLAYTLSGVALMLLGVLLVDVLVPGNLREQLWTHRNSNLALVVAAELLGVGAIVTSAILSSDDRLGRGIADTFGFGVLGLVLMAVAFILVDMLTPGRLGALLAEGQPHPAAWVTASANLATAAIIAAAIS
jgi:uncharacterized membrane protein YjfL (UPF0719 family)